MSMQAVLVLDNNEAVAELSQLESLPVPGVHTSFLHVLHCNTQN